MAAIAPNPRIGTGGGTSSLLNANQQQFAQQLAADTGLNIDVIAAWLLAEEPKSAGQAPWGANNWLNIGGPSVGPQIAGDAIWSNPITAANATAQWMEGKLSIPGDSGASSGIQAILKSVNSSPLAQIQAIATSGWGTSGSLIEQTYQEILGHGGIPNDVAGAVGSVVNTVGNAASSVADVGSTIANAFSWITTPANWLRILEVIGGAVLIYMALKALTGIDTPTGGATRIVKSATKVAEA